MPKLPINTEQSVPPVSNANSLEENMESYEKHIISTVLTEHKGQIEQTALTLDIPRKKLYLRMKKYGLDKKDYLS